MAFFHSLFLGDYSKISRTEYKYGMLRGQFATLIVAVAIFYIALDSHNHVYVFIPWYLLMCAFAIISIFLNRKKYYTAASILLLLLINSLVFLFADVDHPHGGVFFYFLSCSIVGLILFHHTNPILSFLFAGLPVLLGVLAYKTDLKLIPSPVYEAGMIEVNFLSNFSIGILSNFLSVYFLLKQNAESEKQSREGEKNLIKISGDLKASEERFAMAVKGARAGIYEWQVTENRVYKPILEKIIGLPGT